MAAISDYAVGLPSGVTSDLLDLVGDTPLVRLGASVGNPGCLVAAKLEWFNPGGSSKDRIAVAMVDDAEKRGLLTPGGVIVEPTSGNTGVGLAMVAARRGYRCVFVMPDKMSPEKISTLEAYGAEVVICPTAVDPSDPRSYYSTAARLTTELGAWQPSQYHNPANPAAHFASTGPEIWDQIDGLVTHFVAGAGTGGTVSGVGRFLKSMNPDIKVVVADPVGSVYSGGTGTPYLTEGVGEDFWPSNYDPSVVDEVVAVSDAEAFAAARLAARTEGLLVGGSAGLALVAAAQVAASAPSDAVVVVLLADSGRAYLSRIFNDLWMASNGFDTGVPVKGSVSVSDAARASRATLPVLVHTHPDETVAEALMLMAEFGVSQLPVLSGEPPAVLSQVVGTLTASDVRAALPSGTDFSLVSVGEVMGPVLPVAGAYESVRTVLERGSVDGAVLVVEDGRAAGVLTPGDVYGLVR